MKRSAVLALLLLLALPAVASAEPENERVDTFYRLAVEYWGREPAAGRPQVVVEDHLYLDGKGEAGGLSYGGKIVLSRSFTLGAAGFQFEFGCRVMAHELGHELGYEHSDDPHNVMYGGDLNSPTVSDPPCAREAHVRVARDDRAKDRVFTLWQRLDALRQATLHRHGTRLVATRRAARSVKSRLRFWRAELREADALL